MIETRQQSELERRTLLGAGGTAFLAALAGCSGLVENPRSSGSSAITDEDDFDSMTPAPSDELFDTDGSIEGWSGEFLISKPAELVDVSDFEFDQEGIAGPTDLDISNVEYYFEGSITEANSGQTEQFAIGRGSFDKSEGQHWVEVNFDYEFVDADESYAGFDLSVDEESGGVYGVDGEVAMYASNRALLEAVLDAARGERARLVDVDEPMAVIDENLDEGNWMELFLTSDPEDAHEVPYGSSFEIAEDRTSYTLNVIYPDEDSAAFNFESIDELLGQYYDVTDTQSEQDGSEVLFSGRMQTDQVEDWLEMA